MSSLKIQAELRFLKDEGRYDFSVQDPRIRLKTRQVIMQRVELLNRLIDWATVAHIQEFFLAFVRASANAAIVGGLEIGVFGSGFLPYPIVYGSVVATAALWIAYYFYKSARIDRDFERQVLAIRAEISDMIYRDIRAYEKRRS